MEAGELRALGADRPASRFGERLAQVPVALAARPERRLPTEMLLPGQTPA